MSETSDVIKACLEGVSVGDAEHLDMGSVGEIIAVVGMEQTAGKPDIQGWDQVKEYFMTEVEKLVRRGYRRHAGHEPYDGSFAAYEGTKLVMQAPAVNFLMTMFADGAVVGQEASKVVRKYLFYEKFGDMFANSTFRSDSDLVALNLAADKDVAELFELYLDGAMAYIAHATGYAHSGGKGYFGMLVKASSGETEEMHHHTGMDMVNDKIWDLWMLCLKGLITVMYGGGLAYGKKAKEDEALAGILAATEAESDA